MRTLKNGKKMIQMYFDFQFFFKKNQYKQLGMYIYLHAFVLDMYKKTIYDHPKYTIEIRE